MSLVGSLEDLGLGDILQIVSLSRKSGLLLLRSDAGEGRIVLRDGLVRAAFVKGEPDDLRGLLVGGGFLEEEPFDACAQAASDSGRPLAELIGERSELGAERIDSLRREHVERAVLAMFTWRSGEFSFEVREEVSERDRELLLPMGINAQYLTMEATRLGDESGGVAEDDDAPMFSGEGEGDDPWDASEDTAEFEVPSLDPLGDLTSPDAHDVVAMAAARHADEERTGDDPADEGSGADPDETASAVATEVEPAPEPPAPVPAAPAPTEAPVALVAIDPDLAALEWLKGSLSELFARIHIFQDSELGMVRIRQYLARAQRPLVLLSSSASGDGLAGANDAASLVRRLKALAPSMVVLTLHAAGEEPQPSEADDIVARPPTYELAERKRWSRLEAAADAVRAALAPWATRAAAPAAKSRPRERSAPKADLDRLKEMSELLRDSSARGDVLARVLDYAAEFFSRVAIFMVREDTAQGIAQVGLDRAGGPDDAGLQEIELSVQAVDGFYHAVEHREAHRFQPTHGSGRELVERMGDQIPSDAYVAPIESGDRVAALLYADNLPEATPIGDTTALEIILHEAGLALDRALLERALAEAEDRSGTGTEG